MKDKETNARRCAGCRNGWAVINLDGESAFGSDLCEKCERAWADDRLARARAFARAIEEAPRG